MNIKILVELKLRTDIGFNLRAVRARHLTLQRSLFNSREGQKRPVNQLKIRPSITNRTEIFTRSVSLQDKSFLKISVQNDYSKWEIIFKGSLKKLRKFPRNHDGRIKVYFESLPKFGLSSEGYIYIWKEEASVAAFHEKTIFLQKNCFFLRGPLNEE